MYEWKVGHKFECVYNTDGTESTEEPSNPNSIACSRRQAKIEAKVWVTSRQPFQNNNNES